MRWLRQAIAHAVARFVSLPLFQGPFFAVESIHLARAFYVAAELGIADLLAERPQDIFELAEATGADPTSLLRMLRTLAGFGVFTVDRKHQFRMTRRAQSLRTGVPGSVRAWVVFQGRSELWQGFARTLDSVKTGVPAFELAHGMPFYQYIERHPEFGRMFFGALGDWTDWQCREIVRALDFNRFRTVVDVGGGLGTLIEYVMRGNPAVRGILFDRPETLRLAEPRFEAAGLAGRCQFIAGNFLESVPEGADAYVLKNVLNDWDDEAARRILAVCRASMAADSTLLVVDTVLDPANGMDRVVKLLDLERSSLLRSGMRTREAFARVLESAGFSLLRVHPTSIADVKILEARPIAVAGPVVPAAVAPAAVVPAAVVPAAVVPAAVVPAAVVLPLAGPKVRPTLPSTVAN